MGASLGAHPRRRNRHGRFEGPGEGTDARAPAHTAPEPTAPRARRGIRTAAGTDPRGDGPCPGAGSGDRRRGRRSGVDLMPGNIPGSVTDHQEGGLRRTCRGRSDSIGDGKARTRDGSKARSPPTARERAMIIRMADDPLGKTVSASAAQRAAIEASPIRPGCTIPDNPECIGKLAGRPNVSVCLGLKYGAPGEFTLAMRAWRFASWRTMKFQTEALPVGSIGMNSGPAPPPRTGACRLPSPVPPDPSIPVPYLRIGSRPPASSFRRRLPRSADALYTSVTLVTRGNAASPGAGGGTLLTRINRCRFSLCSCPSGSKTMRRQSAALPAFRYCYRTASIGICRDAYAAVIPQSR